MTEQMIEAAMKAMREEQRVNQNLELGFDDDVYDLAVLTIAAIEPFIEGALKDRIEALVAENGRLRLKLEQASNNLKAGAKRYECLGLTDAARVAFEALEKQP